ncbi:MAG: hypothetical protein U0L48_01715, partial [Acutalibacteraceae bacterium]|nr:hypothetical protein [Acutalibacteraceae bacterium]
NEFNTLAMQWAYNSETEVGDINIFNRNGREFVLIKATENGYVELASGKYKEMKFEYERLHSEKDKSVYGTVNEIRTDKRTDMWYLQYDENRGNDVRDSKSTGSKGIQTDSSADNEHLRSSNKGKSIDNEADLNDGSAFSNGEKSHKEEQLDIILENNPANDDYHTWIRKVSDIHTFEEALQDSDYEGWEESGFDPDYDGNVAKQALKSGKITVYSSYPIKQGVFVTPSKMEAESYSGNGKVYEKTVLLTDIAWIDPTQGQYAKVDNSAIQNKKITVDMSDSDRAAILKNFNIDICNVSNTSVLGIDFDNLENNIKSAVEKDLLKKLNELGFLKKYRSSAIDVQFELTGKGIRKSLNSQENSYGGSKADFAKVILNIEKLLDNALLIETHTDKGKGTQRENRRLKQVYVLMSAMQDGRYIIPVQFEVKQYVDDNNRLYLAVALTKIETGVMVHTAFETQMRTGLLPISNISILELFAKINPKDKNFLKYVPDEFLNTEQLKGKKLALETDKKKYAKVSDNEKYSLDIDTSKMTASEFVKSLGKKYHAQFDALDIAYNKKNRVTAAQFASKEAIANTPHSPLFNNNISQKVKLSIVVYPKNHKLKQG